MSKAKIESQEQNKTKDVDYASSKDNSEEKNDKSDNSDESDAVPGQELKDLITGDLNKLYSNVINKSVSKSNEENLTKNLVNNMLEQNVYAPILNDVLHRAERKESSKEILTKVV